MACRRVVVVDGEAEHGVAPVRGRRQRAVQADLQRLGAGLAVARQARQGQRGQATRWRATGAIGGVELGLAGAARGAGVRGRQRAAARSSRPPSGVRGFQTAGRADGAAGVGAVSRPLRARASAPASGDAGRDRARGAAARAARAAARRRDAQQQAQRRAGGVDRAAARADRVVAAGRVVAAFEGILGPHLDFERRVRAVVDQEDRAFRAEGPAGRGVGGAVFVVADQGQALVRVDRRRRSSTPRCRARR